MAISNPKQLFSAEVSQLYDAVYGKDTNKKDKQKYMDQFLFSPEGKILGGLLFYNGITWQDMMGVKVGKSKVIGGVVTATKTQDATHDIDLLAVPALNTRGKKIPEGFRETDNIFHSAQIGLSDIDLSQVGGALQQNDSSMKNTYILKRAFTKKQQKEARNLAKGMRRIKQLGPKELTGGHRVQGTGGQSNH